MQCPIGSCPMGQSSAWQALSYRQVEALAATSLNRFVRTDSKRRLTHKKKQGSFQYLSATSLTILMFFPLFLTLFYCFYVSQVFSCFCCRRTWASFSIRSEYPKRSKSLRHAVMLLPTTWGPRKPWKTSPRRCVAVEMLKGGRRVAHLGVES